MAFEPFVQPTWPHLQMQNIVPTDFNKTNTVIWCNQYCQIRTVVTQLKNSLFLQNIYLLTWQGATYKNH